MGLAERLVEERLSGVFLSLRGCLRGRLPEEYLVEDQTFLLTNPRSTSCKGGTRRASLGGRTARAGMLN